MIAMASSKDPVGNQKFQSLLSANAFPGRRALYIYEVARVLRITQDQVLDLVEEGAFGAIDIGSPTNKSSRRFLRIPVCEYDAYVLRGGKLP